MSRPMLPQCPPYFQQVPNAANVINLTSAPASTFTDPPQGTFAIVNNASLYFLINKTSTTATWQLIEVSSGVGTFSSLTVTPGPTSLTGPLTVASNAAGDTMAIGSATQTGAITLGASTAGQTVNIANAVNTGAQVVNIAAGASGANTTVHIGDGTNTAGTTTVSLGSTGQATNVTTISGGSTGGIALSSGGAVSMVPAANNAAGTTVVLNARVGIATYTGQTTAAGSAITLTLTNSFIAASSAVFVTLNNLGTNDAELTVQQVKPATGSMTVIAKNNGAAALNGDINLTFWVLN